MEAKKILKDSEGQQDILPMKTTNIKPKTFKDDEKITTRSEDFDEESKGDKVPSNQQESSPCYRENEADKLTAHLDNMTLLRSGSEEKDEISRHSPEPTVRMDKTDSSNKTISHPSAFSSPIITISESSGGSKEKDDSKEKKRFRGSYDLRLEITSGLTEVLEFSSVPECEKDVSEQVKNE